ncbi:MAG: PIG-L family deacetylase [Alphaproteobacteria bacterium]|nr:PIG-L family deacetylase [Alphaproteobacteria bacterium]
MCGSGEPSSSCRSPNWPCCRRAGRLLRLVLPTDDARPLKLLCLGAHADDIEIGCGGTVLRLVAERPDVVVRWVVFSGDGRRDAEARASAADFLAGSAAHAVEVMKFRDGYFPSQHAEIKDCFEALKRDFDPSLVLTHWNGDAHQDHRIVSELTGNTFRNHLVLQYEIPKYDGDTGSPNFFVPLSRAQAARKVALLARHFPSQHGRGWFTDETFLGLARLRGIGCNAPEGLAEAFFASKVVF